MDSDSPASEPIPAAPAKPKLTSIFSMEALGLFPATGEIPQSPTRITKPVTPQPTVLTEELRKSFLDEIAKKDSELKEVKLDITSLGPWSSSKLKCLEKCPFQFYLKYILQFKVPSSLQTQSDPLSANVGKAAHAILEDVVVGKDIDKAYADVKAKYLADKSLTEQQWEEYVVTLRYNIEKFKNRIDDLSNRHPFRRVLTELRIGVTRDYQPTGFFSDDVWLRGVVDMIVMLECMDIIIFDHKTGGGEGSVNMYKPQLDWYKVLFHFGIEKIEGAQAGIHFIKAGDVKMADYSGVDDIENKLKNVLEMSLEGAVDALIEKGYFKHVRGAQCKWCEYDNIGCKSGDLKPIEINSKRWIRIAKG